MLLASVCAGAVAMGADAPASAPQPALNLSLADAVKLAQAQNPVVREAAARVAGSSAQLKFAHALENPALALAHAFGKDTGGTDEDVFLIQTFQLPGKRNPAIKAAGFGRDASVAGQAQTALDLTSNVQSAYYEALRADENRQLAANLLGVARQFAESAKVQFQAGEVPRASVVRGEIETSRAEQALTAAETERTIRYNALVNVIGVPENTTIVLTDKLGFAPVNYNLADLQTLALKNRPDLQAARLLRDSLAQSVKVARAEGAPDLFVELRHETLNLSTGGSTVRPGIVFPLLDYGRIKANVAAANAAVAEQQAKLDDQTRRAQLEVEDAYHTLEQARSVVESFATGRLTRAKELLDMAQTGFEKGATSYLELVDAQQAYRNEEADYARALADYNIALADLIRAVGGAVK